jgi:hypothetical protein
LEKEVRRAREEEREGDRDRRPREESQEKRMGALRFLAGIAFGTASIWAGKQVYQLRVLTDEGPKVRQPPLHTCEGEEARTWLHGCASKDRRQNWPFSVSVSLSLSLLHETKEKWHQDLILPFPPSSSAESRRYGGAAVDGAGKAACCLRGVGIRGMA